ncbi:MAG TPA: hypothetical protein DDZ88_09885, partial [Verrucomicrobiales bacterium]|nr:hypothetical protein [Verrucomicrobiales bacterium]
MFRRCRFTFSMLLMFFAVLAASAQEGGDWRKEQEAFEKTQARLLLPVQQILLSELGSRQQAAAKGDDPRLQAGLEARHAMARQENDLLKQGRVPHPSRVEEQKNTFLRAATGRQWALSGTQNVKRVGLRGSGMRSFSEDGRELGDIAATHLAPGVFGSRRRQDSGWTCFTFSADLQRSLCLIVSQVFEGVCLSSDEARPASAADNAPSPAAASADSTDLLDLLETRYRQKRLQHEAARRALIEDFLRDKTTP